VSEIVLVETVWYLVKKQRRPKREVVDLLFALADNHGCVLAGGDTTRAPQIASGAGPLTICITALGEVPRGAALTRTGACIDDDLYVSNCIGDAALALRSAAGDAALDFVDAAAVQARLDRPQPRVALGLALRGLASSCIDVSDGLLGDLAHICERSGVGAQLDWPALPLSAALRRQPLEVQQQCALAGGDDYELLFTAPPASRREIAATAARAATPVARIGRIVAGDRPIALDAQGRPLAGRFASYDHFG
jgi:thiamine-monophosphate kinase